MRCLCGAFAVRITMELLSHPLMKRLSWDPLLSSSACVLLLSHGERMVSIQCALLLVVLALKRSWISVVLSVGSTRTTVPLPVDVANDRGMTEPRIEPMPTAARKARSKLIPVGAVPDNGAGDADADGDAVALRARSQMIMPLASYLLLVRRCARVRGLDLQA
jgi:hypothetical protein